MFVRSLSLSLSPPSPSCSPSPARKASSRSLSTARCRPMCLRRYKCKSGTQLLTGVRCGLEFVACGLSLD